jgi:DNA-directed RNA polymerase subunit alpha
MAKVLEATTTVDIKDIVLSNSSFGPQEIRAIVGAVSRDFGQHSVLRGATAELEGRGDQTPASAVRLGVCYFLLGKYPQAVRTLSSADGGAVAHFYLGKACVELGDGATAVQNYQAAKAAGYDADACSLAMAEALRYLGRKQEAMTILDQMFGPIEQTAEYLYQRGATVAAIGGNPNEVVALYQRAVEVDGRHVGALFGLALENDRRGNDDRALELYQRAADCFPTHLGVLLNLGLLYEDLLQFDRAQQCYQRILDAFPDHLRARLYAKDAGASGDMFYDEEAQKRHDRLTQVLNIPVTDFELSVRSRNCLHKMGVRTLGDLARTSEAELLASKNFGETSLTEIRDILGAKGLELGQFAHERTEAEPVLDLSNLSPDEQALLSRPISDLNLSVRARKCMVRLGMTNIGELVRKSGDDLLECKNFGVTSLNEVRSKLQQYDLKLRGD